MKKDSYAQIKMNKYQTEKEDYYHMIYQKIKKSELFSIKN